MQRAVLITGLDGFVARHCAVEFLNAGYHVRGTLWDMADAAPVRAAIAPHADIAGLEFVQCDLLDDANWEAAMTGRDCVAHVASPVPQVQPDNADLVIRPAVEGTLRVLKMAENSGIADFVQTSSAFAVYYGHEDEDRIFDEADWTDLDGPGVTPYVRSKTLAEKAARAHVSASQGGIRYSSINPGYIFGPAMGAEKSSSLDIIRSITSGRYPGTPRLCMPAVDVRDVARLHRRAIEDTGEGPGRYLAVAGCLWMTEIADVLRDRLGDAGAAIPRRELPDFIVKMLGERDPGARSIYAQLGRKVRIDNRGARHLLGREFISVGDAAIATEESLAPEEPAPAADR